MALDRGSLEILARALAKLDAGFSHLPEFAPAAPGRERMEEVLLSLAGKLQDNYPYFHPLYAGQMLKPPHPVAQIAYSLAMYLNPNNHALDGGRATSVLEKEAVAEIAAMFGWKEFLGHLSGGGTMANLEALWVGGPLRPVRKNGRGRPGQACSARRCGYGCRHHGNDRDRFRRSAARNPGAARKA